MNLRNILQVMEISKYAAIFAISLRTSFIVYSFYKEYQLTKPLKCKIGCDFDIVWNDLNYDEGNITLLSIKDIFDHALRVGSKGLIQITEYMQNSINQRQKKERRFYGWKNTQLCYSIVVQEFNRKINFSREVISKILTHKGYNYEAFADTVFSGMRDNQQILQLNIGFEFQVVSKFRECQEQLNGEGIIYYIQKFMELLTKNSEEIYQIKDMIIRNNHQSFKSIIVLSYVRDIWYKQFGFEYNAFLDSIKSYQALPLEGNLVYKGAQQFFLQLEKIFA